MDTTELGKIIRHHRKISGLTRVECARLAGVGKTVVYDIEHGKASVQFNTLLCVLKVLNIRIQFSSPLMDGFPGEKIQKL
jgi:HTH-type transcriptional regulator/antitoxin HipB